MASLAVVDLERGASPSVVSSPGLVEDSVAHAQPGALAAFFKTLSRHDFCPIAQQPNSPLTHILLVNKLLPLIGND